jgi:hypothetical protein
MELTFGNKRRPSRKEQIPERAGAFPLREGAARCRAAPQAGYLGSNDMDATRIDGIAGVTQPDLQGCSHGKHDYSNHPPSRDDIPRRRSVPLEPVVLVSLPASPKTKPAGIRHLLRERVRARSAPAMGRAFHRLEPVGDVQSADQALLSRAS